MSTIEDRLAYLNQPIRTEKLYGDFTSFYITITVCTVFGIFLFALNLICGCCSKYQEYWNDRFTGNRWLVSLWTATAHKQPPLDLTELEYIQIEYPNTYPGEIEKQETPRSTPRPKRLFGSPPEAHVFQYSAVSHQPARGAQREEFVELHKRESEI